MAIEQNDHDILIEIRTRVDTLITSQREYFDEYKILAGRVTQMEVLRSSDNAKLAQIQESVQKTLDNYSRIGKHDVEIENLKEELTTLQKRSNILDGLNALGVAISGVVGFVFGHR